MAASIPFRIQRDEVQLLERALEEPWQHEHRQAMRAFEWDFIVGKCLLFPTDLQLGWRIYCRDAAASEITDFSKHGAEFKDTSDQLLQVARRADERAREFAERTGHAIEGVDRLREVIEELQGMREKYLSRWSLLDRQVIEQARAEHQAGEYPTPGEALSDLLAEKNASRMLPAYAELREWADRSLPPPEWLDEEDDPAPEQKDE